MIIRFWKLSIILKNQIKLVEFIILLIAKLINDPFNQIAVIILTYPLNKVFWKTIGTPLKPQEYFEFVFLFIND